MMNESLIFLTYLCICCRECSRNDERVLVELTAGEDEWAGMGIHGKVVQLKLAFGIDGEPANREEENSAMSYSSANRRTGEQEENSTMSYSSANRRTGGEQHS